MGPERNMVFSAFVPQVFPWVSLSRVARGCSLLPHTPSAGSQALEQTDCFG